MTAAILCHHCGRDYSREYWAMGPAADPCVCKGCRRDTNRDAADAPRWTPGATVAENPREMVVTKCRKRCRVCGGEWDGLVFGLSPSKGSALPLGICPTCSAKDDAYMAAISTRTVPVGMPIPELSRPKRVADD